ncbi:MAG: TraB/GumN family protein [Verrucomicrobiales bacterium]|nr:TraB/GumN family protein [Verrucomicrobiales bacterium]
MLSIRLICLGLLLLSSLLSPSQVAGKNTSEGTNKNTRACVWKIQGSRNTVYIAGSVHLLRQEDYPLPKAYDIAYEDSTRLVFEIDMKELSDPKTIKRMQTLGTYSSRDSIRRHISPGTFKLLAAHLTSRGLPTLLFEQMKPGLLAINLSSMEALRMGARADLGLEVKYHNKSLKDGKPSSGLETVEYQVTLFDKLNDRQQDRMLRATLEKIDAMQKLLKDLIDAWKIGDVQSMDSLLNEEFKDDPKLKSILIDKRNQNWIPKIEKAFLDGENVLFIVGTGHLVGKGSVIDLLRRRGYILTQMGSSPAGVSAVK